MLPIFARHLSSLTATAFAVATFDYDCLALMLRSFTDVRGGALALPVMDKRRSKVSLKHCGSDALAIASSPRTGSVEASLWRGQERRTSPAGSCNEDRLSTNRSGTTAASSEQLVDESCEPSNLAADRLHRLRNHRADFHHLVGLVAAPALAPASFHTEGSGNVATGPARRRGPTP